MTHNWSNSTERGQWECLNCGATCDHEYMADNTKEPTADDLPNLEQPGSGEHAFERVRKAACPGM
jgi:hypothetical protein